MSKLQFVRKILKLHKGFDENSTEILNSTKDLTDIIITVEKRFLFHSIDFKYDSEKDKFVRLNTFESEERYLRAFPDCCKCSAQCFSTELSVDQFTTLISKLTFNPIAIRLV